MEGGGGPGAGAGVIACPRLCPPPPCTRAMSQAAAYRKYAFVVRTNYPKPPRA